MIFTIGQYLNFTTINAENATFYTYVIQNDRSKFRAVPEIIGILP